MSTSTFTYTGLGDRARQTTAGVAVTYTLDLNAGLVQVLADGTEVYWYGLGRIAQQSAAGTDYFLGDALGSMRQLADASGSVTLARNYDPYGSVLSSQGSGTTSYDFTGEWRDSTGLIFLRARYYSSAQGRFLSRDSWVGDYTRPLSLNAWNYTNDNPVNGVDPSGQCLERKFGEVLFRENGLAPIGTLCLTPTETPAPPTNGFTANPSTPVPMPVPVPPGQTIGQPTKIEPIADGYIVGSGSLVGQRLHPNYSLNDLEVSGQHCSAPFAYNAQVDGREVVYDLVHYQKAEFTYKGVAFALKALVGIQYFNYTGTTNGFRRFGRRPGIAAYTGFSLSGSAGLTTPAFDLVSAYTSHSIAINPNGGIASGVSTTTFGVSSGGSWGPNISDVDISVSLYAYNMVRPTFVDYLQLNGFDRAKAAQAMIRDAPSVSYLANRWIKP